MQCTGIHAGVLTEEGCMRVQPWHKPKHSQRHRGENSSETGGARRGNQRGPQVNDEFVRGLDPDVDVLLFPREDALLASEFPWGGEQLFQEQPPSQEQPKHDDHKDPAGTKAGACSGSGSGGDGGGRGDPGVRRHHGHGHRHRLVVLEGSWGAGKTMARSIVERRAELALPAIPCVKLPPSIVGQYWKVSE